MKDEEKNLSGDCALNFIKLSFELKNSKLYKEAIEMLYKALSCSDIGDGKCEVISQIASLYSDLKNYDRAIDQYEKALDIDPDNKMALFGLANVYNELGKYNEALRYTNKLISIFSDTISLAFYFKILLKLEKYTEILDCWDNLDPEFKSDTELMYIVSNVDKENKKNILENIVNLDNNNIKAKFDLAVLYFSLSDYKKSIDLFLDIKKYTNDSEVYYYLGRAFYITGDIRKSIDAFLSAIKLNPNSDEYYFSLSKVYIDIFWYKEAYVAVKKSLELNELSSNLSSKQLVLAWLNYKLGKKNQALLVLENIKTDDALFQDASILKSIVLYASGDIVNSKLNLENILLQKPKNSLLYSTLGKIYKDLQYTKNAIVIYENGLEIQPDSIEFKLELIDLYIDDNNLDRALKLIDEVNEINPNILPIYNSRARVFYKQREYEKAKCELLRYLEKDKNNPEVFYFIGLISNDMSHPYEALEYLNTAINLKPDEAKYYSQLSRAYELKGDIEVAMSFAKEACIVNPSEPLFYQRALDLAKKSNNKDEINLFKQKVEYFKSQDL